MLITDEKIPVTWAMLERANMTRGDQVGIPVDPKDPAKGLRWKKLIGQGDGACTVADLDTLEEYFLQKQQTPAP